MPYDKYAHADAYYEQLEKMSRDKTLREQEVEALREIACIPEFLGYLTDEIKKLRIAIEIKNDKTT
tara:strand:+ start:94 stop:291 length:198 start_codon:yes stop_codon:yes gene_type:complete